MFSSGLINALHAYIDTLEEPLQEVNAQIEIYARKVMAGETGTVTSFTVNGKSYAFADKLSAEDSLMLWTRIKGRLTNTLSDTGSTGVQFQIPH